MLTRCTAVLSAASMAGALALAVAPALGQASFSSTDRTLSVVAPKGWQATGGAGTVTLTAADGAQYRVLADKVSKPDAGTMTTNIALRLAAQDFAKPLLSGVVYSGARALTGTVPGAVFRFRGSASGSQAASDSVEIWALFKGAHSALIVPGKAPQPDHTDDLAAIAQSVAFGGARAAVVTASNTPGGAATADSKAAAAPVDPSTIPTEGYAGHLVAGDGGFKLQLYGAQRATMTWTSAAGPVKYAGTYQGTMPNYTVALTRDAASKVTTAPAKLTLYMTGLGGMRSAKYVVDASPAKKDVASIDLTEVATTGNQAPAKAAATTNGQNPTAAAGPGQNPNGGWRGGRRGPGGRGNRGNRGNGTIFIPGVR